MTFRDKIGLSWSNLGRRKVRTLLTSVGVVVGITTLVTMVSLVNGVQSQVKSQFEKLGLDRVVARPPGEGGFGGFDFFGGGERTQIITPADVKRWSAWPEAEKVLPEIEMPFGLISRLTLGKETKPVRIASESSLRRGPFSEAPTQVAGNIEPPESGGAIVISRGVAKRFGFEEAGFKKLVRQNAELILQAPRGEKQSYRLVISGVSSQGRPEVHLATPDRLKLKSWWLNKPDVLKTDGYDAVTLRAADVSQAKLLVARLRKEKVQVESIDALLDAADKIFSVITAMLALVSSVALFVACIGIVNTMIMSIYERTREIGTLKAMGASRGDIRALFMLEAGLIGLMGGVAGVIFSWILGRGLNHMAGLIAARRNLPLPDNLFIITPGLALSALGFAALIGIVAGLYPANRAARLDPLMALRHE